MQSAGLGNFRAIPAEPQGEPRLPTALARELSGPNRLTLVVADDTETAGQILDEIENPEEEDGPKPPFMRGDFDANLADQLDETTCNRIAADLLQAIEADLQSRQQWEKIATRAIEFLGLIFEDASSEPSNDGSISRVWHTLMLEAAIQFWANAQAEFLPADGPVKVRDDKPADLPPQMGDNGGPPLDEDVRTRDQLAEDFETDFNRYLTTCDRQYCRDFSRMLFSLGPIGTQFRKVYYNPLRKMAVSEWVKAENLIVSNEAAHLATAGRVTEKIMMRHADVKRLQYWGWWLDVPLTSMPEDTPTQIDQKVGQIEGVKPGPELPADHRHTIYECYTDWDLPGFEHEEEGELTGLPLPYKITLDKDSRKIVEIRRNWKEDDDTYEARQRYVMFGMVPGLGFYYLGFAHILGNTERALTTLEREQIDAGMFSIFPGFVHAKGTIRGDTTQIRVGPGQSMEINLDMKQKIADVLMAIPYKELSPNVMALTEKLEDNGRKLVGAVELQVGEGQANIPVGTMLAMIEQATKVTAAVHKGLHQSRTEELELLRDLIAEDPTMLSRFNKSPAHQWEEAQEFEDFDLVPASDPNTPSHIHRIMRAVGLSTIAQQFPDIANRRAIYQKLLATLQVENPEQYETPPQTGAPPPSPQQIAAQAKVQAAQITAQSRAQETAGKLQDAELDRQSKEQIAAAGEQTERLKVAADAQSDETKMHDSAADRAAAADLSNSDHVHDASQSNQDRMHDMLMEHLKANLAPKPSPGRVF